MLNHYHVATCFDLISYRCPHSAVQLSDAAQNSLVNKRLQTIHCLNLQSSHRNIFCCCQLYAVFGFPHSLLLLKRSNLSVSHVMSHVVKCSNVLQSSVFRTHKWILRTGLANICCMNWLSVTSFTYVWGTCLVYFYRSPIWGFSEQAKPTVQKQLIQ